MVKKVEFDPGSPDKKQIKVTALREGTVIDHLAPGAAMQVIQALRGTMENEVLIGLNLVSKKLGHKDLIKIERKELSQEEINKVSLISPGATFSIIRDFQVADKVFPELPESVVDLIKCGNPSCITNKYDTSTVFFVLKRDPVRVRCKYCERIFKRRDIVFK